MSKFVCLLAVFVVVSLFGGCSSALMNFERDNSLDRVEKANGRPNLDGEFDHREEVLAKWEIVNRKVAVDPKKGLPVIIRNGYYGPAKIEIRTRGWCRPVVAGFFFQGCGSKRATLMPGWYTLTCTARDSSYSRDYQVTTAPQWDDASGEYFNGIMVVAWDPEMSRENNGDDFLYHQPPPYSRGVYARWGAEVKVSH